MLPGEDLRQRDGGDPVPPHGDHVSEMALFDLLNRGPPKARGQDAVKPRRRSAALQVSQHGNAGLVARARLDLSREHAPDAAQPHVPERVQRGLLDNLRADVGGFCPLPHARRTLTAPPGLGRALMRSQTSSMSKGTSGTRMMSAPPARPPTAATHPASRPITSTTITRWRASAVGWSLSQASITAFTAVSKPMV